MCVCFSDGFGMVHRIGVYWASCRNPELLTRKYSKLQQHHKISHIVVEQLLISKDLKPHLKPKSLSKDPKPKHLKPKASASVENLTQSAVSPEDSNAP